MMLSGSSIVLFGMLTFSILAAFGKLKISVRSVVVPVWILLWGVSLFKGLSVGVVEPIGLVVVPTYFVLVYHVAKSVSLMRDVVLSILVIVFSLALALHWMPGISRQPVFIDVLLGDTSAQPFSLYANFDKAMVGLALVAFYWQGRDGCSDSLHLFRSRQRLVWFMLLMTVLGINLLGLLLGLELDIKFDERVLAFYWFNLVFTCVAEEAFFRLLIQGQLTKLLARFGWGASVAVTLTTLLFTLAHLGGIQQVEQGIMVLVAGFSYALFYQMTKSLPLVILLHFGVNAVHITCLTYPMVF